MIKMVKMKDSYCKHCEIEIYEPIRKPIESMQKTIWIIISIATFGIGFIVYLVYNEYGRKKIYCPTCHSKLISSPKLTEKPKELIEALTPKETIIKKVEKKKVEKKKEKEIISPIEDEESAKVEIKIYCPFCGEELEEKYATCPYCAAALKF
jgi:hypothetical protein